MKPLRSSLAALAISGAAIAAGFFGFNAVQNSQFALAEQRVDATREQISKVEDLATVFRQVGRVVEPSVVHIQVKKTVNVKGIRHGGMPFDFDEDMLKRMFPDRDGDGEPDLPKGFRFQAPKNDGDEDQGYTQMGTGSGVIMEAADGKGYVVTNNHVAGGASEMEITLADGRRIKEAKLLGADPKSDLALVEIQADRLIPAKWGDSSQLERGDWIMAFGSPFGYIGSMTHGIVSAMDRHDVGILGRQGYENFIQVDAPINPGNSGGPLVNIHGDVVGINTAIASRNGGFQGVGFAIPSNQAKMIYQQLKTSGKVTRGWLGVSISDVARDLPKAKSFGFDGTEGVLVEQTFANTPANGKLEPGDIITKVNGKKIESVQELRNQVAFTAPGEKMEMTIFRDGKQTQVSLKVGEQPEDILAAAGGKTEPGEASPGGKGAESVGLRLTNVTDELAERFSLEARSGALITGVAPRSIAAEKGLRPGDVITKIDGKSVDSAQQASKALSKADLSKGVRLYVTSREGSRFVFLQSEK